MDKKQKKNFPPGYFEKPEERNWFSEHIKQILSSAFVIVSVVLATIFVPRGCTNDEKPVVDTLVTDSIGNDSVSPVVEDSVSSDSVKTTPKVAEGKTNVEPKPISVFKKTDETKTTAQNVATASEDVAKEALSVIRGKYGNNPDRRRLLKERYQEIQNKVNEMYQNGQVK